MKKLFRGYYGLTEGESKRLWETALIVLDANVLLNLYLYSEKTRKAFLDLLGAMAARLWLPHQVALEYHRNRISKILQVIKRYDDTMSKIGKLKEINNGLKSEKTHPFVKGKTLSKFDGLIQELERDLKKEKLSVAALLKRDPVRSSITKLYADRVGLPYGDDALAQVHKAAEQRFQEPIPPGNRDAEKKSNKKYGDVIIWFQMMNKAKSDKVNIIFVSDDSKDDWWSKTPGQVNDPRPELCHEFRLQTKKLYFMCEPDEFMERANEHLKKQVVEKEAIKEVRTVSNEKKEEKARVRRMTFADIIAQKPLAELRRQQLLVNESLQHPLADAMAQLSIFDTLRHQPLTDAMAQLSTLDTLKHQPLTDALAQLSTLDTLRHQPLVKDMQTILSSGDILGQSKPPKQEQENESREVDKDSEDETK